MNLLVTGVVLFAGLHLIKSFAPALRESLQKTLGNNGYRGLFSLLVLASIGLIIFGWRSTIPQYVYTPPRALVMPALALILFAFFLLSIHMRPSRLRRLIRHPQLTGVALWAIAHLMLNGDSRAIVLFGGLAVWAVVEIIAINHREGAWTRPESPPLKTDLLNAVIAVVVYSLVIAIHPWIAGVSITGPLQL